MAEKETIAQIRIIGPETIIEKLEADTNGALKEMQDVFIVNVQIMQTSARLYFAVIMYKETIEAEQ